MRLSRYSVVVAMVALFGPWSAVSTSVARASEARLTSSNRSYRSQGSCMSARMEREGDVFFWVNTFPVPCYTTWLNNEPNGDETSVYSGSFDSSLLLVGANTIHYGISTVNNQDYCTKAEHIAELHTQGVSTPLFHVYRDGQAFTGETVINLSLNQIDPVLAETLVRLRKDVAQLLADCVAAAPGVGSSAAEYEAKRTRLLELQQKLDEWILHGFGGATPAELDAFLAAYEGVLPAQARAQLVAVLDDMKRNVGDLRSQVTRTVDAYRTHMDDVVGSFNGAAGAEGCSPGEAGGYEPSHSFDDLGTMEVPEATAADDGFDETNDPYSEYADMVLEALDHAVSGTTVTNRNAFLTILEGWHANQATFEAMLAEKSPLSIKEHSAFLLAQDRVVKVVEQYVDGNGWFLNSPIPLKIRAWIDELVAHRMTDRAESIKRSFNQLSDSGLNPRTVALIATGSELAEIYRVSQDQREAVLTVLSWLDGLAVAINTAGAMLSGDISDVCELITGEELCIRGGRSLSFGERVAAAVGIVAGSRTFWAVVGAGLTGTTAVVARTVAKLKNGLPNVSQVFVARLVDTLGPERLEELCDELGASRVVELFTKLGDTMKRLADLSASELNDVEHVLGSDTVSKLARDLEGTEILKLSREVDETAVKNLASEMSGLEVRSFVMTYGETAAEKLALDLNRAQIEDLEQAIGGKALKNLAQQIGGGEISALRHEIGEANLAKLGESLSGLEVRRLHSSLGPNTLADLTSHLSVDVVVEVESKLARAEIEALGGNALGQLLVEELSVDELSQWLGIAGAAEVKNLSSLFDGTVLKKICQTVTEPVGESIPGVPGRVLSRVNLRTYDPDTNSGWEHVVERHFNPSVNASQFTLSQAQLRALLDSKAAVRTPVTRTVVTSQRLLYLREFDSGFPLGLDKFSNYQPTSTMTILTDEYGNLFTATPGVIR